MPNNVTFNFDPDSLRTKIYGSETDTPIQTTDGKLQVASISDVVSVTATNLDIRDLSATSDNIQVYGSELDTPIQTTDGKLQIASISDVVNVTATDLDIRNITATSDNIQMYGSELDTPIQTTDGKLQIASISDVVNVTATDLDIRNITATSDNIQMYGSELDTPIQTTDGKLEIASISDVVVVEGDFTQVDKVTYTTGNDFTGTAYVDTSKQKMYSFYVYNGGSNSADVQLEVSAYATEHYYVDVASRSIASGAVDVFVPKTFLKYTRLAYKSTTADQATDIDVIAHLQT